MNKAPEFARPYRLDAIGGEPHAVHIKASEAERAALAERFGLVSIETLEADATIRREGQRVWAEGRLRGRAVQRCVATGDPIPARIEEPFALRFDPEGKTADNEVELEESDLDLLTYEGGSIDLGEAVAQGFSLALDPFPRVPDAEERLRAAGVKSEAEAEATRIEASPFAALKALKGE
ncbi:YceD family protein [Sphingomonas oryzagri]